MTTGAEKRALVHASKRVATLTRHQVADVAAMNACTVPIAPDPSDRYPDPNPFDPPPPGETGTELTGAALVAVMDTYFAAMEDDVKLASAPATLKFGQVKDIRVNRVGRWCLITVKFKAKKDEPNEFTFRIGRPWAGVLSDRLARVLSR